MLLLTICYVYKTVGPTHTTSLKHANNHQNVASSVFYKNNTLETHLNKKNTGDLVRFPESCMQPTHYFHRLQDFPFDIP